MTKDLTQGSPMRLILGFTLSTLLGLLFQQLYNVVDTMIVGKLLGSQALAAVGSTGSVNFLVIGFCTGVCSGFAIPAAQRMGSGEHSKMRQCVANAAWLSAGFALVLTAAIALLCRTILVLMKTPADIFQDAYLYIFIIFLGIPATFLYNLLAGVARSLGDSRTPVYFLALSSVLNIALDAGFILLFHTGVAGAALATVISQLVSGVACFFYMRKKFPILHMSRTERAFDPHTAKVLCRMGLPMGLQYSITAIGSIVLQSAVNTLGSTAVASVTAGQKVSLFFCCPFDAMGATMATYCGQNVGAMKLDRLARGVRDCALLGLVYSLLALGIAALFAPQLVMLFLDAREPGAVQVTDLAARFLLINTAFYFPLSLVNIVRFSIQGMGFSTLALLAGVLEMLARTGVGQFLVPAFGYTAACFASPAAWICADLFLIPACAGCVNHLRKVYMVQKTLTKSPQGEQGDFREKRRLTSPPPVR